MHELQQTEEILFTEALALPAARREAFLHHACQGAASLRLRIQSLLRAHETAGDFMERTLQGAAEAGQVLQQQAPVEDGCGQQIGRYKLLERLGEGGCGVVYLAEQEEPVRRRVALKIIKLGMDTRAVIARFEAERQALAMMEHPNIARVLDAGATATGRPYFVMELVRGRKITEFCDELRLSIEQRLRLFIDVCHAVQHAHQKGIIHRDLKPSNVLVTRRDDPAAAGCPKVIDFGIVKATQERLTDKTVFTGSEQFIGTPAYMSPEQAQGSGDDVDTRTDIYSLGVLLYELLAGRTPFDGPHLARAGLDTMRKTILETEPLRPSAMLGSTGWDDLQEIAMRRGADSPALMHRVRGDLDWIVMRCLEKNRNRRYETANGLAMDVRRHLACEPVVARPPSRAYTFAKFVRRNRTAVIAGAAITIAVIAGLAVASIGFARARVQRHAAETARHEAENLVSFMVKDLRPELQRVGRLPLTAQVAEQAVRYFSKLPPGLDNPSTERNRAVALEALAYVRAQAGNTESAVSLWHEALAARRLAATGAPADPLAAVELALTECIDLWPSYPLVLSQAPGPGSLEIDARLAAIVERAGQARRGHVDDRDVTRVFARLLAWRSAYLCGSSTRPDEALAIAREAEALYRDLLTWNPDDTSLHTEFVALLATVAEAAQQAGSFETAIRVAEESIAFADSALEKYPGDIALREKTAFTAMQLSHRLRETGRGLSPDSEGSAISAEAVARERWRELTQLDPQNFSYRHQYAWAHLSECNFLRWEAGRLVEAREATERFVALLSSVARSPTDFRALRGASFSLGQIAGDLGEREGAQTKIQQAREWHRRYIASLPAGLADQPEVRSQYHREYSVALASLADWPEVERQARAQIDAIADAERLEPSLRKFSTGSASARTRLGYALIRQGSAASAIPILQDGIAELRASEATEVDIRLRRELLLETSDFLAEALIATGDTTQALGLLEKNVAGWGELVAARPTVWELCRHFAASAFLLATVLDPSEPRAAGRRLALLERASTILTLHAAETHLSIQDMELLKKIETMRGEKSAPP